MTGSTYIEEEGKTSGVFESVTLRGVRLRLWCLAPFRVGPLKQYGIAIVKNVPPRRKVKTTRLYFLGVIPQGVWEGEFDKRGVQWWARPFMRYVHEYMPQEERR